VKLKPSLINLKALRLCRFVTQQSGGGESISQLVLERSASFPVDEKPSVFEFRSRNELDAYWTTLESVSRRTKKGGNQEAEAEESGSVAGFDKSLGLGLNEQYDIFHATRMAGSGSRTPHQYAAHPHPCRRNWSQGVSFLEDWQRHVLDTQAAPSSQDDILRIAALAQVSAIAVQNYLEHQRNRMSVIKRKAAPVPAARPRLYKRKDPEVCACGDARHLNA
jgi:hypothetical protein